MRRDPFKPSLNGFRFPSARTESSTTFGLGAPILPAFGMSAGMAWLALDRYLAGRPVPSDAAAPRATDPLHAELVMRQANALAVASWNRLVEWQCLSERALPGRPSLAGWSRAHWRRARKSLDAGVPIMLFLVLATGRHANPSLNKAVLAVGYRLERRTRRAAIRLYDPDRPSIDHLQLVFRTGYTGPLDAHIEGEASVRGFIAVPYDRPVPASLSLEPDESDKLPIDAPVAMLGTGIPSGPVTILARTRGSAGLLRVRRDGKGRISAEDEIPGADIATDTGAAALVTANRMLMRTSSGDLLDIRRVPLLGWRTRAVTRAGRVGADCRIDAAPAVLGGRTGLTVMACGDGRLVRYRHRTGRQWSAEPVDIGIPHTVRLVGTPALIRQNALHVLCRTDSGDLMHLHDRPRGGWTGASITVRRGGRARFVVADDPIALSDAGGTILNVVTRARDSSVLLFRKTGPEWSGIDLGFSVRAAGFELPPAASRLSALVDQEGTVHVTAKDLEGGLIHLWYARSGAVGGERVTDQLTGTSERVRIDGAPLLAAGPAGGLHIFAHGENRLLLFRWAPVAGWSVEDVGRERGLKGPLELAGDPVLHRVGQTTHIAFADSAGRLHTVCVSTAKRRRGATRGASAAVPRTSVRRRPVGKTAAAPEPTRDVPVQAEPVAATASRSEAIPPRVVNEEAAGSAAPAVRAAPSPDVPARVTAKEPPGVTPVPEPGPRVTVPDPAPAPRSNQNARATAKWRKAIPAARELPLLSEDDEPKDREDSAAAGKSPEPPPPAPTRNNAQEIQRIMALGEESPAKVIKAE